jgi:hypothetical protein
MPHVLVKLYSGRSEQQKARLAEALSKAVMAKNRSRWLLKTLNQRIGRARFISRIF